MARTRPDETPTDTPDERTGSTGDDRADRGTRFDGVPIGRPATGALLDAGFRTLSDLPDDLEDLASLHGVGPRALERLRTARTT
ncbi:MAG: helix-hairpin-helix domain-containing protein [Kineosporiaceae bacterium]